MTQVSLTRFDDRHGRFERYTLDREAGSYSLKAVQSAHEASWQTAGYADEVRVGLIESRHAFVAIYALDGDFMLRVGRNEFRWREGQHRAERRAIAPFVKRFRLWDSGEVVFEAVYWYYDNPDRFPAGPEATDILLKTALVTRSNREREAFVYTWTANCHGRDVGTQAFIDEMEQHLRSIID